MRSWQYYLDPWAVIQKLENDKAVILKETEKALEIVEQQQKINVELKELVRDQQAMLKKAKDDMERTYVLIRDAGLLLDNDLEGACHKTT